MAGEFISPAEASQAMLDGLTERIRFALKARIYESIAPDVEAVVETTLSSMKLAIESYQDHAQMRNVVNIILTKGST